MKKFFLAVFMLFNVALIGGGVYVLAVYVSHQRPAPSLKVPSVPHAAVPVPAVSSSTVPVAGNAAPGVFAESATRKMLFKYHNPKARQVAIRADFTGWKAEPMQKESGGFWTYTATLSPGEYAYCFTVDDKTFKDPANKRTKQIGRTMVSAIVVGALPSKAAK
jgi:hypothetical protein